MQQLSLSSLTDLKLDKIPVGYQALGVVCGVGVVYLTMNRLLSKRGGMKVETESDLVPGGRELSGDEWSLATLQKVGGFTNSYVNFIESKQPVTEELVTKAAKMIRARHPLLRMRIDDVIDNRGKARHFFIPMEDDIVDVEMISKADWQDVHTAELQNNPNAKTGPLWRIRVMPHNEENGVYETVLFVTFNHTIIDGNIMMRFIDELLSYMSSVAEGNDDLPESLPMVQRSVDAVGITRVTWFEKIKFKFFLLLMKYYHPTSAYLTKFGTEISRNPDVKKETRIIPIEFSKEQSSKILQMSRRHKATVSGTLATAAGVAIAQILQDGVLKSPQKVPTMFSVDVRRQCKPPIDAAKTFANYAPSENILDMKVKANSRNPDEFWKLAADYTKGIHSLVAGGVPQENMKMAKFMLDEGYNLDELIQQLLADEKNGGRFGDNLLFLSNLGNLSYFDRSTPRLFELTRRHCACEMAPLGVPFAHYICTFHGRLFWSLSYVTNVTSREKVQEYANLITEIIEEMCEF